MKHSRLRIGIIGAGENTRKKHIPGLRAIPDVEIVAVCNRRPSSTMEVAQTYGIERTYFDWHDLVADTYIDAVVIGTWPYLHAPITLAALQAGKHVLTEARMASNAAEARQMWQTSQQLPNLVCQIVPSPFGLKGDRVMRRLIDNDSIGELRELHLIGMTGALADPHAPFSWRQDAVLSGVNMLTLGILHETISRWLPPAVRVLAQSHAFVPERVDPECGLLRRVETPDSVQVLIIYENGVHGVYHLSGVAPFGGGTTLTLFGSRGALRYDFDHDRIYLCQARGHWEEVPIEPHEAGQWNVEADFIDSIRTGKPVTRTDFKTGVQYMEFTEAVLLSCESGQMVELPLPKE